MQSSREVELEVERVGGEGEEDEQEVREDWVDLRVVALADHMEKNEPHLEESWESREVVGWEGMWWLWPWLTLPLRRRVVMRTCEALESRDSGRVVVEEGFLGLEAGVRPDSGVTVVGRAGRGRAMAEAAAEEVPEPGARGISHPEMVSPSSRLPETMFNFEGFFLAVLVRMDPILE